MSAFGNALTQVLRDEQRTKEDVARVAGLAPSTIYRLAKGEVRPDPETLPKIISAATDNLDLRYDLIIGHLVDEVGASNLPLSGLVLRRSNGRELTAPPAIAAEIFLLLACAEKDTEIQAAVKDLALLAGRATARAADQVAESDGLSLKLVADDPSASKSTKSRKNTGAPTARPSLPPRAKAS